jgi:NADPH:quinone reductase-like Zn-dependent oxidoreductase
MNGLTAKMALATLSLRPGDTLLITGGAGAVGGYAIQLANRSGLRVIADALDGDVELIRELGANEVVPRGGGMDAAVRGLHHDGVDGAIDAGLVGDRAAGLVRAGGAFVCLRKSHASDDQRLRHAYISVIEETQNTALLTELVELLADGILTPRVAVRLPISAAREAHRLVERGGLRGRVVLMFDQ